jgi:hypothetical protein
MPRTIPRVSHRFEPLDSAKPLKPRQELFAQAIARGASRTVAYREAGYKGQANISRMSAYPNIKARIAKLQAEAAARSVVTTDQLIAYLLDLIETNRHSQAASMAQMARAAIMDLGKVTGLLDPKNKPKGGGRCTCGGLGITEIRRIVVEPDGREWEY